MRMFVFRREEDKLRSAIAAALAPPTKMDGQPQQTAGISCVFAHADVVSLLPLLLRSPLLTPSMQPCPLCDGCIANRARILTLDSS